jgi:hypothetical protein
MNSKTQMETKMNSLHHVKRATHIDQIKVGGYFATNGAWNRKYQVTKIKEVLPDAGYIHARVGHVAGLTAIPAYMVARAYKVKMVNAGFHYADGRWLPPVRAYYHTVMVYQLVNGELVTNDTKIPVIPMENGNV